MGEYDGIDVDTDFSGDMDGYIPDSHFGRRFPVTTNIVVKDVDLKKAA